MADRKKEFVHLHVHTEFSLLDGLSQINRLVSFARESDMRALAITDHGTMFGVIDFFRACKAQDIQPIIGCEAYLTRRDRRMTDKQAGVDTKPYHMLLLARNQIGYQNLLKIASAAQIDGYYYRPRIDHDFLAAHAEGLIATSGCLAAEIPRMVEQGREKDALEHIGWYQDVFGPENFYLELQHHDIDQLHILNKWLVENQGYAQVPLLATNDVHYVKDDDYDAHDTLLCIQTGSVKAEQNRLRFNSRSFHLRTPEEMWQLFRDVPEALTNSLLIAEQCNVDLSSDGYHLPVFPVPEGHDAQSYLRYLCEKGLHWRYGSHATDPEVVDRLNHELHIIHDMGFDTYFLIVWDLCEFARHADIWWNVRGSGAGSVAAYSLGITNIDPLQNSLLFERFLNPGRQTMPDIDLDYPEDRRAEMITYCAQKYGEDKVAAIITFGTMGSKAAIRDVGRALDMPLPEVDRIARLIPTGGKPVKFKDALGDDPDKALPDLKAVYESDPHARSLIDTAWQLEGITRHASTHAAGVIVADKPLVDYIPLHRPTSGSEEDAPVKLVTQFPMETCESIGLLKVDFLGLSTLTIMRRACELVEQHHGIRYDLSNIPYRPIPDDLDQSRMVAETFEMMGRGETIGVFQLESQGMRRMLTDMRPQKFEHIVAGISLYRPGPLEYIPTFNRRLHGEEAVEYKHPNLQSILEETYGIIVYQEQLMQIGAELFGYSLGEADLMRRAVSKKKKEALQEHRQTFVERGPEHGVDADSANAIFDDIEFFARYGFNKCVTGDTQVIDADTGRLVRIEDVFAGRAMLERTVTLDTDSLRLTVGDVSHVMENGIKPVFRLKTTLGREITATANHPFYTLDGWRQLGDLTPGDQIAVPRRLPGGVSVGACPTDGWRNAPLQRGDRFVGAEQALPTAKSVVGQTISLQVGDIAWDAIATIQPAGEQMTYDLTVPGPHNFVANDIIVHNSHAADYAVITCQTAFLKCHYPHEFMAALMSVQRDDSAKVSLFAADCHRMGIQVLPPDVNKSLMDFDIETLADGERAIRFGLAAVKNVGVGPLEHIIARREAGGEFQDLDDFCRRVDMRVVQKRALESLIRVGALDMFGHRPSLLAALDRIASFSIDHHKAQDVGQMSLFGEATGVDFGSADSLLDNLPEMPDVDKREMLRWEKELVGLYVTDHPLSDLAEQFAHANIHTVAELVDEGERMQDRRVQVAGLVTDIRHIITKKGDPMAILTLEDITGTISIVMFPRTWGEYRDLVEEDVVLVVQGKADTSRGDIQVIADAVRQNLTTVQLADEVQDLRTRSFTWLEDAPAAPSAVALGADDGDEEELEDDPFDEETGEVIDHAEPEPPSAPHEPVMPASAGASIGTAAPIEPAPTPSSPPPRPSLIAEEPPGWLDDDMDERWLPVPDWAGDVPPRTPPPPPVEPIVHSYDETGRLIPPPAAGDRPRDADDQDDAASAPPAARAFKRRRRPEPESAPEPQPSRLLTLVFERSGDAHKDRRRMSRLHGFLTQYPGPDKFCFVFEGGGKKRARLDFPNHPIGINDEMLEYTRRLLGDEHVIVE
ncbi:MAG: DNA polymerase III subunit alpha [Chloroflexi bacterium]|nr:DNA polymerase III subunit alpha [Chloroflexota bacterium]